MFSDPHHLPLNDQDVTAYHEQGFWIGPKLFDRDEVEALRREVMRLVRGDRDFDRPPWRALPPFDPQSLSLTHIVNGWWVNAKVLEIVTSPVIGAIGARLMGTPHVRLVHDSDLQAGPGPPAFFRGFREIRGRARQDDGCTGRQCGVASRRGALECVQHNNVLLMLDRSTGHGSNQRRHVICRGLEPMGPGRGRS